MPSVIQKKRCLIAPKRAFEIVQDFQSYPDFLPWCAGARLQLSEMLTDEKTRFIADLIIKYTVFSEVFTTSVTCCPNTHKIDIEYLKGPFKHLNSYWHFYQVDDDPSRTDIEFMINFEMKFSPLQKVISVFFEQAMKKMISAFEARFEALEGKR